MPKDNILVVEDEDDILELIRYNLTREGYSVVTAMSGEDAIDIAEAELPDLILLDLMLPGVDGFEVCRRLKQNACYGINTDSDVDCQRRRNRYCNWSGIGCR